MLCPSLCWNDLSCQAPHKSSLLRENFKITFRSVLGHIRFVLMLVLHSAKSRDVTSLLKWIYKLVIIGYKTVDFEQQILALLPVHLTHNLSCIKYAHISQQVQGFVPIYNADCFASMARYQGQNEKGSPFVMN